MEASERWEAAKEAAKEAVRGVGFDLLIICGFSFDPHVSEEAKRYGNLTVLIARMNPDLAMGDELLKFKFQQVHGDVKLLYQFLQNVQTMNLTESILPIPFSTSAAMAALCEWGVYADLIEVDAAHDFHSAWADINTGHAILRPGGVMFGHDYFTNVDNRGVARAVDLFAKVKGLRVEPDGQHWILRSK